MKKSLLIISALCLGASSGFAQLDTIPNANFDNWTDATHPSNWGTLNGLIPGGVTQATAPDVKGSHTIAVSTHTVNAGGVQTVGGMAISNGTITAASLTSFSIKGGFPFRERAVALTGTAKYTQTGTADQPSVGVILTHWVSAVMTGTVTTTPGHRDTVAVGGVFTHSITSNFSDFSVPLLYYPNMPNGTVGLAHQSKGAVAPDSAQILLFSSKPSQLGGTPAVGSTFFVDSLAFDYGCALSPNIHSNALAQDQYPAAGDTLHVNPGATYSRTWTIFIPKSVTSPIAVGIDSVQITGAQITATPTIAGATYTVTTDWPKGMIGSGTIACVTVTGNIPANAGNHYVTVTMTPLLNGPSPIGLNFTSPSASVSYLKIGTGTGIATLDSLGFNVSQNKPNPFDGTTVINFTCPVSGKVDFVVVDVLGRQVYDTNISATAGSNSFTFSSDLATGTYFFSISNGTDRITKKMVVTGH